jgi:hypothetical protein
MIPIGIIFYLYQAKLRKINMEKISFFLFFSSVFLCSVMIIYGVISIIFPKRIIEYEMWNAKKFLPKWFATRSINQASKRWYFSVVIVRGIVLLIMGIFGLYIFYSNSFKIR